MARFYGWTPGVIGALLVEDAIRYSVELRAIEKSEMRNAIVVSAYPHMADSGRTRVNRELEEKKSRPAPQAKKISGKMAEISKSIQDEINKKKDE